MWTVAEILEQARRLKPDELSRLVAQLNEHLSSISAQNVCSRREPYSRTLALSGIAHADRSDVSSHKGKHLAEAYAARQDG